MIQSMVLQYLIAKAENRSRLSMAHKDESTASSSMSAPQTLRNRSNFSQRSWSRGVADRLTDMRNAPHIYSKELARPQTMPESDAIMQDVPPSLCFACTLQKRVSNKSHFLTLCDWIVRFHFVNNAPSQRSIEVWTSIRIELFLRWISKPFDPVVTKTTDIEKVEK